MNNHGRTLVMVLLLSRYFFQSFAQHLVNLFSVILSEKHLFFSQNLRIEKMKKVNLRILSHPPSVVSTYSMVLAAVIIKMIPKTQCSTSLLKSLLKQNKCPHKRSSQEKKLSTRRNWKTQGLKSRICNTSSDVRKWSRTRESRPYLQRVETWDTNSFSTEESPAPAMRDSTVVKNPS